MTCSSLWKPEKLSALPRSNLLSNKSKETIRLLAYARQALIIMKHLWPGKAAYSMKVKIIRDQGDKPTLIYSLPNLSSTTKATCRKKNLSPR